MTWLEARRILRKGIIEFGDVAMQLTGGRGPMPPGDIDPSHLNNPEYSVVQRTIIAQMLCYDALKDCSARSLNELLSGINDPDRLVRRKIASALGACGYSPAIPALIRLLKESNDDSEIKSTAFALTAMGESAVRELIDLLLGLYYLEGDQAPKKLLWNKAIGSLVEMGSDVVDWLLEMFLDEHPDRWFIAFQISRQYFGDDTLHKLREMFEENRSNEMLMGRIGQVMRSY